MQVRHTTCFSEDHGTSDVAFTLHQDRQGERVIEKTRFSGWHNQNASTATVAPAHSSWNKLYSHERDHWRIRRAKHDVIRIAPQPEFAQWGRISVYLLQRSPTVLWASFRESHCTDRKTTARMGDVQSRDMQSVGFDCDFVYRMNTA